MIRIINSWAQGIVIAVIIATIIEIILPEGNNKKYVKVVLGMYILFAIIYPILNSISKEDINVEKLISSINKDIENTEDNLVTLETNSYIETTYKANLKEDIMVKLNEKGYNVLDLKVYIETSDDERYGQINSMVLNLDNIDNKEDQKENLEEGVKEIKINVSNTDKTNNKEKIDENKLDDVKEFLKNSYGVEKERIHINEEDMYVK